MFQGIRVPVVQGIRVPVVQVIRVSVVQGIRVPVVQYFRGLSLLSLIRHDQCCTTYTFADFNSWLAIAYVKLLNEGQLLILTKQYR